MKQPYGLILAGGQGRRLGGQNKANLVLGDQTLLARAQGRLLPQIDSLAISANTTLQTPHPCLPDTIGDFAGPLAGILAGLHWAAQNGADHIVSVAVDTPFFPPDLVPRLLLAGEAHPLGLAIAVTNDGAHPTFGLWPVALAQDLQTTLQGGLRRVRTWTDHHNAAIAQFPETTPPTFFNINTPEDLAQAEAWS